MKKTFQTPPPSSLKKTTVQQKTSSVQQTTSSKKIITGLIKTFSPQTVKGNLLNSSKDGPKQTKQRRLSLQYKNSLKKEPTQMKSLSCIAQTSSHEFSRKLFFDQVSHTNSLEQSSLTEKKSKTSFRILNVHSTPTVCQIFRG